MPARMIPLFKTSRDFPEKITYGEKAIYKALSRLSDSDFFCRYSLVSRKFDLVRSDYHEMDFVIYNRKYGLLVVEAKDCANLQYKDGCWFYNDDKKMKKSPYDQAAENSRMLFRKFIESPLLKNLTLSDNRLDKCGFWHAVWFPTVTREEFEAKQEIGKLPSDVDLTLTLFKDDLSPEKTVQTLKRIFKTNPVVNKDLLRKPVNITDEENVMIANFLDPEIEFTITNLNETIAEILLEEQKSFLNVVSQRVAFISGYAGTGKTLIAVEKAKQLANKCLDNEKVLFLCFNTKLNKYWQENNPNPEKIDFYTIDGFCKGINTRDPGYKNFYLDAKNKIESTFDSFEWTHIIIDEGQDFGNEIDQSGIIPVLKDIIKLKKGCFYVMFDSLQNVQNNKKEELPSFIQNFIEENGPTISLTKNCRNTNEIATTSVRLLDNVDVILNDDEFRGKESEIYYCGSKKDCKARLDKILSEMEKNNYSKEETVILTFGTEENSILYKYLSDDEYNGYLFTTCRKFKGLEANNIILIDFAPRDNLIFSEEEKYLFYVGASRAKFTLRIITSMGESVVENIYRTLSGSSLTKNPKAKFAKYISALEAFDEH